MIIEARKLHLTTRDPAPQPGELVYLQRQTEAESTILRTVAHWPVMGVWEVAVKGVHKPEIVITVQPVAFYVWREVAGR